jgi:hypothetical protein
LLSVCDTVIASTGDDVVLSLATSVTNAARAMPVSFFVPCNVFDAYRFPPSWSFPAKACWTAKGAVLERKVSRKVM